MIMTSKKGKKISFLLKHEEQNEAVITGISFSVYNYNI